MTIVPAKAEAPTSAQKHATALTVSSRTDGSRTTQKALRRGTGQRQPRLLAPPNDAAVSSASPTAAPPPGGT